jgi:hypothetical protein
LKATLNLTMAWLLAWPQPLRRRWRWHQLPLTFLWLVVWLTVSGIAFTAHAFESVRDQEIRQCLPGEIATWGDGVDRPAASKQLLFGYSHQDAPAWFTQAGVTMALKKAAAAWSQCGIAASVMDPSTSTVAPAFAPDAAVQAPHLIRVQWHEVQSAGNFGLANLQGRTLNLSPAAFAMIMTRNPAHNAAETLQMVISHEMGHFMGLMAHSRRCVDVTSYYNNGKGERCFARDINLFGSVPEYRASLPTACDLQRCRMANGLVVPK